MFRNPQVAQIAAAIQSIEDAYIFGGAIRDELSDEYLLTKDVDILTTSTRGATIVRDTLMLAGWDRSVTMLGSRYQNMTNSTHMFKIENSAAISRWARAFRADEPRPLAVDVIMARDFATLEPDITANALKYHQGVVSAYGCSTLENISTVSCISEAQQKIVRFCDPHPSEKHWNRAWNLISRGWQIAQQ